MQRVCRLASLVLFALGSFAAVGADWPQFRGPGGLGASPEKGLPVEWSSTKNIVWRTKMPGPGSSSPVTLGNRVFLTCYSGYGLDSKKPGKMEDLRLQVLCMDRGDGKVLWANVLESALPEHKYDVSEGDYHGYAASTPTTDGERLYVFFGASGVFCFDLGGKQLWHANVGKKTRNWGSGASPLRYKDLLVINASVESGELVALDKVSGKPVWKAPGINTAWNTPMVVTPSSGEPELVISVENLVRALNPDTGKELWKADGVHRYVCPSVIAHEGIVYAIGGGHTSLAVKTGGRGDVTKSHVVWRQGKGSNIASPVYHQGHLYWAGGGDRVCCQEADTGKIVYDERLANVERIFASPVLADGKLYYVKRNNGAYVVAATPKFTLVAHNVFEDDKSRSNASVAISDGHVLLRTDEYLYCIGKR